MPTETIVKEIYGGEVKVIFYPNSHRYRLEGERSYLLSVTGITGIIDKSRVLMGWALRENFGYLMQNLEAMGNEKISKEMIYPIIEDAKIYHDIIKNKAAEVGTAVHDWAEAMAQSKIDGGELPEVNVDHIQDTKMREQILKGIGAFLDWYNENNVEFIEVERFIYSRKHGYVGKFDAVAKVNGIVMMIDYKTSSGIYDEANLQVSAYRAAYEEETGIRIEKSIILNFNKDTGEFLTKELSNEDHDRDFKVFLATFEMRKWKKEMDAKFYAK